MNLFSRQVRELTWGSGKNFKPPKPQVNSPENLISKCSVEYRFLSRIFMSIKLSKVQLDNEGCYSSADTTVITLNKEGQKLTSLKYILALVNSKLLDFHFKSYGKLMDYRYEYYPTPVGLLRIKISDNQEKFVKLVDRILTAKSDNPQADTSALEKEIDELVYQLYGLTEEEIRVVAGKV